jgi:hypothetical protein
MYIDVITSAIGRLGGYFKKPTIRPTDFAVRNLDNLRARDDFSKHAPSFLRKLKWNTNQFNLKFNLFHSRFPLNQMKDAVEQ